MGCAPVEEGVRVVVCGVRQWQNGAWVVVAFCFYKSRERRKVGVGVVEKKKKQMKMSTGTHHANSQENIRYFVVVVFRFYVLFCSA